jgi:hypothetical protein
MTLGDPFAEAGQPYAPYGKWHVGEGAGRGRPITASRPGAARPHIRRSALADHEPTDRRSDGIDQLDWLTGATDTSNRDGYLSPAQTADTSRQTYLHLILRVRCWTHLMHGRNVSPSRRDRRAGGIAFRGCDHECAQAHRRFGV